jgi:alkyl sulfatase BDS1-like metallo-beta-lactamase superfamily hydrolase
LRAATPLGLPVLSVPKFTAICYTDWYERSAAAPVRPRGSDRARVRRECKVGFVMNARRGEPTSVTRQANERMRMALPFSDRQDFDDARRGFVATLSPMLIKLTDGKVIWDMESYAFLGLDADCPDTVNPSLWRQGQLNAIHGLFEVAPGFYQVRGLDLSNMTIIEGQRGVIVIDPLVSAETAAAGLALYRQHRGNRPVTAVIYTHSHVDHFGGVKGVVSESDVRAGTVPILAPEGFMEHAVAENVYAGTAMARRAIYMYGALLPKGPDGQVSAGLGMTTSLGTVTLIPPTHDITRTGQEEVLDGVRIVFQMTPGTEAPSEMNFFFPEHRALCAAENATHNLHNLLTLRGALVRDPHVWSRYLNEAVELFGKDSDVLFASHHWPRWGSDRVGDYLRKQRDLYGYLHDQTLRLLNQGYVGSEIAETFELPPSLANEWYCRGYYGSISHNVKAIYQRYMGWFDGNPAHLWEYPPVEAATRYVECMGGADAVLEKARRAYDAGDYRWVAQLVNHVVFADPKNTAALELQATALEQLGYQVENATWRNFYLMGARELREGVAGSATVASSPDVIVALSMEELLDALAIQINGPRAWGKRMVVNWSITDRGEQYVTTLENGVLTYVVGKQAADADATVTLARPAIDAVLLGQAKLEDQVKSGKITIGGDGAKLGELFGLLDKPNPTFNIVTP